ncbi:hypothetical protein P4361_09420 [Fictibacillus sp. B-59209]|uniref:hypothetical protein n=1 Tax=Fictibacillus sp. B-59209 TaxID=3024873 RepID=UPI002E226779|nr:hypothetical protein [Fictibacillus sp. B-59209]
MPLEAAILFGTGAFAFFVGPVATIAFRASFFLMFAVARARARAFFFFFSTANTERFLNKYGYIRSSRRRHT